MHILNAIGAAGLAWCASFHLLNVEFAKNDPPGMTDKEVIDETMNIAKLSLIPALFAFMMFV